jgi:predicted ATPase
LIRTPDQRLRVFISSTLGELAEERQVARRAVEALRLTPVMFELGARPHPARALYRAYLDQSHVFLGMYWERYGWVAPDETISGLEDEYVLSASLPRLVYVKEPAPEREERLHELLRHVESDDTAAYKRFHPNDDLEQLITDDLAILLSERFLQDAVVAEPGSSTWGVHLPEPPSAIVGRDGELAALCGWVTDPNVRLVTLVGPGGIGKTRLGLELARSMAASYTDGAVMVALQDVRTDDEVAPAIAAAMGITFDRSTVDEALAGSISTRRVLLFLDNFEHVLGAASAVHDLLEACPNLTILVTSRAPLGLRGEHEFHVDPLELPLADTPAADHLAADRTASVRLFIERARSQRVDFALNEANRDAVFELCRRLEGIPLAIELAAARVHLLTPQAMIERLDDRFELLVAKTADLPARQRTLTATIEWSHELLTPDERRLFARLAVFAGGFTLKAVEGVCGDGLDVLETLSGLVEHSLVTPMASHGAAPRFRMFEMIRAFAHDRLEAKGEMAVLCDEHLDYFEELAAEAEPALRGVDHLQWMARMTPEWDNLRAAWSHALSIHQAQRAAPLAGCGFMLLWKLGRLREMWPLIAATLDSRDELDDNTHARLLFAGTAVSFAAGKYDESLRFIEEFESLRDAVDDQMILGAAELARAFLAGEQLDITELDRRLDAAETIFRNAGELWMLGVGLTARGSLASLLGDDQRALDIQAEVFDLANQAGNDAIALQSLVARAMSRLTLGDPEAARDHLRRALTFFEDYPYFDSVAYAYEAGAGLAIAEDAPETAGRLLGAADMARRAIAAALWPLLQPQRDAIAAQIEARIGADALEQLRAEGASLGPRRAVALLDELIHD